MIDLALDGRVFIRSTIDEAVQELDLMFNTDLTELIGYPEYGTNFEQFSWRMAPEEDAIKNYINKKISETVFLSQYKTQIDVSTDFGQYRLIYYVKIHIYDSDNTEITRTYEFR